jgi:vanillate O-demethylase monooxygenase subunit
MADASGHGKTTESMGRSHMVTGRFVHNTWYVAAWAEEVVEGKLIGRTILGLPVVLYRKSDGTAVALQDRCAHRFAPLSMGRIVDGDKVQCLYHGLEYDETGACVKNPHGGNISSRCRVDAYPLVEKHKALWIWMGDKDADPSKIPDFGYLDSYEPLHGTKLDSILVKANYELIVDNLLDLSHTAFLHEGILGNEDTVESEDSVEMIGDNIVVRRDSKNATAPGLAANFLPGVDRVDKYSHIKWMGPCNLWLHSGIAPHGAGESAATGYDGVHILTPETTNTTHYFFTAVRFNVLTKGDDLNRAIQEKVAKTRRFAFEHQDGPIIEAQQVRIDASPTPLDPVILPSDVGPVRYKRILARMLEEDSK